MMGWVGTLQFRDVPARTSYQMIGGASLFPRQDPLKGNLPSLSNFCFENLTLPKFGKLGNLSLSRAVPPGNIEREPGRFLPLSKRGGQFSEEPGK